jgi:hypothetical protein
MEFLPVQRSRTHGSSVVARPGHLSPEVARSRRLRLAPWPRSHPLPCHPLSAFLTRSGACPPRPCRHFQATDARRVPGRTSPLRGGALPFPSELSSSLTLVPTRRRSGPSRCFLSSRCRFRCRSCLTQESHPQGSLASAKPPSNPRPYFRTSATSVLSWSFLGLRGLPVTGLEPCGSSVPGLRFECRASSLSNRTFDVFLPMPWRCSS